MNTEEKNELRDWIAHMTKGQGVTYVPDPECPYKGKSQIWGLETEKGNWLGCCDSQGTECLMIFRTRELAEQFQDKGKVVSARPNEWWKQVERAAKKGFPDNVLLLVAMDGERTKERIYSCESLVIAGLDVFMTEVDCLEKVE